MRFELIKPGLPRIFSSSPAACAEISGGPALRITGLATAVALYNFPAEHNHRNGCAVWPGKPDPRDRGRTKQILARLSAAITGAAERNGIESRLPSCAGLAVHRAPTQSLNLSRRFLPLCPRRKNVISVLPASIS